MATEKFPLTPLQEIGGEQDKVLKGQHEIPFPLEYIEKCQFITTTCCHHLAAFVCKWNSSSFVIIQVCHFPLFLTGLTSYENLAHRFGETHLEGISFCFLTLSNRASKMLIESTFFWGHREWVTADKCQIKYSKCSGSWHLQASENNISFVSPAVLT